MFALAKKSFTHSIRSWRVTSNNNTRSTFIRLLNGGGGGGGLQWSYLSNPGTWPLRGDTIGQVITNAAHKFGDNEAIVSVYQSIRKTFSQIHKESDDVAAGLLSVGLKPGDRLGIWGPNSYQWYLTQMAAAKAGLVLVHVNPAYKPNELEYCLKKVSVKALICDVKFKTSDYYKMMCDVVPELPTSYKGELKSHKLPDLNTVIMISNDEHSGTYKFQDLTEAADSYHVKKLQEVSSKINFDDPTSIQFTSGTTGFPKAAVLSHHMIINNAYAIANRAQYSKDHKICLSVPLFHCFGCVLGSLLSTITGSTCVIPTPGFDPEATIKCIQDERITTCYETPTMFVDLLTAQRKLKKDLSSVENGIISGAPIPQELFIDVVNELNVKDLHVVYGMTETSPVTFQTLPSDSLDIRSSTIGYPSDHVEVKVADKDGNIVPVGVAGEMCVRGYVNFKGYFGDPDKTDELMGKDRWIKSGDVAMLQPDGHGKIIGRIKDMIIRGGENIFPAEVEHFLMTHPDINEAQVFGVPDRRMGEEVAVWIRKDSKSNLNETLLKQWCQGKIAHFKIPRYIFFKEELPTTLNGKIQKYKMREITIQELQLT